VLKTLSIMLSFADAQGVDTTLLALAERAHPAVYGLVLVLLVVRPLLSRRMSLQPIHVPHGTLTNPPPTCPELVDDLVVATAALAAAVSAAGPLSIPGGVHDALFSVVELVEALQGAHDVPAPTACPPSEGRLPHEQPQG
jgi:hypothetical protein